MFSWCEWGISLGVKPSVVNWIIDFLRGRQQRVKVNEVFADWLDVPAGVPQGTAVTLYITVTCPFPEGDRKTQV